MSASTIALVVIGLLAGIVLPLPIILRLFGLLPPNGDPAIFWIVFFVTMIDVGLIFARNLKRDCLAMWKLWSAI